MENYLGRKIRELRRSKDLTQEQLARTLMPVGKYTKEQIREIAEREGLLTANKPDSMEICFVPDDDYAKYIIDNSSYEDKEGNKRYVTDVIAEKVTFLSNKKD